MQFYGSSGLYHLLNTLSHLSQEKGEFVVIKQGRVWIPITYKPGLNPCCTKSAQRYGYILQTPFISHPSQMSDNSQQSQ